MNAKTVLYATVGAPVVAARKIGERVEEIRASLNKEADSFTKTASKKLEVWADEGQKLINKITEAKVVDELTAKVDFDQVSNQVGKLRDQLEDMLSTWRSSFRPEKFPTGKVKASASGVKFETAPAKKTASSNGTAKKSATKSTAKKATAKKAPARKATAAKAPVTKATEAAAS
jgi:DNA-binding protein HU-beta